MESETKQTPLPIDDLKARVQLLREAGVRVYRDGGIELEFSPSYVASPIKSEADRVAEAISAYALADATEGVL